jgi:hypothetical protein
METCKECNRPKVDLQQFKTEIGKGYAIALTDKQFLDYLKKKEAKECESMNE